MEESQVMTGRELLNAVSLFHEEVSPQITKLKYLIVIADSGIIGEDHHWNEEVYDCLSSGLSYILEGIVNRLQDYRKQLEELHDLERERTEKGEIIDPQGKVGPGKENEQRSDIIQMLEAMLKTENELLKQEASETEPAEE